MAQEEHLQLQQNASVAGLLQAIWHFVCVHTACVRACVRVVQECSQTVRNPFYLTVSGGLARGWAGKEGPALLLLSSQAALVAAQVEAWPEGRASAACSCCCCRFCRCYSLSLLFLYSPYSHSRNKSLRAVPDVVTLVSELSELLLLSICL